MCIVVSPMATPALMSALTRAIACMCPACCPHLDTRWCLKWFHDEFVTCECGEDCLDSYDTAGHSDRLASVVFGTPVSLQPSVKLEVPHGAESFL